MCILTFCIVFFSSVSVQRKEVEHLHLAIVNFNGTVSLTTPLTYHTSCALDMTYFPWDHQSCSLEFSSWAYDIMSMDIVNSTDKGGTEFFVGDGEWILHDFLVTRDIFPHPDPYPVITYTLKVQRKPSFVFNNLVLPNLFINFCAYLVFLLPPESGEKVSMTVTLLLAIVVFLLVIGEHLPAQSDVTPVISKCKIFHILFDKS